MIILRFLYDDWFVGMVFVMKMFIAMVMMSILHFTFTVILLAVTSTTTAAAAAWFFTLGNSENIPEQEYDEIESRTESMETP